MTDTYPQEQFIGKTFNERLNKEMIDYYQEKKFTILGYFPRPGVIGMVHTLEDGAIKAVGASDPFDQITNNFGKFMAAMFCPLVNAPNPPAAEIGPGNPPIDITGASVPGRYSYSNNVGAAWNFGSGGESYIQIGAGVTPPLITDFQIETPFTNGGVEDSQVLLTGSGGYNAGTFRVSMATSIGPTGGAGTINEMGWICDWSGTLFMMTHDAISPGVPFVLGETIFVQYFFQI